VPSQNRAKTILNSLNWFFSADLQLESSESILLDGVASLLRGLVPTSGRLVLTNRRLVYMPLYVRFIPRIWSRTEVNLDELDSVTGAPWLRSLWGGLPGLPLFRLKLKDGGDLTFQTLFPGRWIRDIQGLTTTSSEQI